MADLEHIAPTQPTVGGDTGNWGGIKNTEDAAQTTAINAAADAVNAEATALAVLGSASPDLLASGAITRSATGAATGFAVAWPDGATGTFAGTESTSFPGAIDSYTVTHVLAGVTHTYTQPALTRNSSGAVTARPPIVVT